MEKITPLLKALIVILVIANIFLVKNQVNLKNENTTLNDSIDLYNNLFVFDAINVESGYKPYSSILGCDTLVFSTNIQVEFCDGFDLPNKVPTIYYFTKEHDRYTLFDKRKLYNGNNLIYKHTNRIDFMYVHVVVPFHDDNFRYSYTLPLDNSHSDEFIKKMKSQFSEYIEKVEISEIR